MSSGHERKRKRRWRGEEPEDHRHRHGKNPSHQNTTTNDQEGAEDEPAAGGPISLRCHPKKSEDFTVGTCRSIRDFAKVGRLGQGTYGVVYKALDRRRGGDRPKQVVALKRCIPHHEATDGFPATALREISVLRLCGDHPNVVSLLGVVVSRSGTFLSLEHVEHDLARLVDTHHHGARNHRRHRSRLPPLFAPAAVKTLVRDLLRAIRHVHDRHCLHRDVKPCNLLYGIDGRLRLADFGLARPYDANARLTLPVASLWYRAPELLLGAPTYGPSIDLWAVGCILAELLVGRPLFPGTDESNQIRLVVGTLGPWPAHEHPYREIRCLLPTPTVAPTGHSSRSRSIRNKLLDLFSDDNDDAGPLSLHGWRLLTGLLDYRPDQRWTANQALASPYFGGHGDPAPTDPPEPLAYCEMPRFPPNVG